MRNRHDGGFESSRAVFEELKLAASRLRPMVAVLSQLITNGKFI
jgi:hypothetical protein